MTYDVEFAENLCGNENPLPQQLHEAFLAQVKVELGASPYAASTSLRNLLGYSIILGARKYHIVFSVEVASKTLRIVMMSLDRSVFNLALSRNTPR